MQATNKPRQDFAVSEIAPDASNTGALESSGSRDELAGNLYLE